MRSSHLNYGKEKKPEKGILQNLQSLMKFKSIETKFITMRLGGICGDADEGT